MKKLFLIAVLPAIISVGSVNAQTHEQGTFIIDAYYGVPNLISIFFKTLENEVDAESFNVKSVGPVGGRIEYLLSEKFGVGLNMVYASSTLTYREQHSSSPVQYYNTTLRVPRLRVMGTWNVHLSNNEKVDTYIGGGIGYTTFHAELNTNDPKVEISDFRGSTSIPLAFRLIEVGQRFYIIDNLGLHWQFGIGAGPLIAIGITGRI